jgi:outer membrane lipoprotein SlyB
MMKKTLCILAAAAMLGFTGCKKDTSGEAQTQQQLAEAQQRVQEAERQAEEARRQLEEAQRQAEQARQQQELEEARRKLEQAQRQADAARKKLAEVQQKAAQTQPAQSQPAAQTPSGGQGLVQSSGDSSPATAAVAPAPPAPKPITVPAGTPIVIRTLAALSTKDAKSGDPFRATLAEPLVIDGVTIAPRGADVEGVIVESDPGGRVKGVAQLSVTLRRIHTAAGEVEIQTSSYATEAKSGVKKDLTRGAIMTGVGAAIGAIAGGGKGAAVGAGVGAGAGTATAMATRGESATIPAETVLTFQLKAPFTVQVK